MAGFSLFSGGVGKRRAAPGGGKGGASGRSDSKSKWKGGDVLRGPAAQGRSAGGGGLDGSGGGGGGSGAGDGSHDNAETFHDLGIADWLTRSCRSVGLVKPTAVQCACVPRALAGDDIVAIARTGAGKTAAFALPMLQALAPDPYGVFALVLEPTRELAFQVSEQFRVMGAPCGARDLVVVGGLEMAAQSNALHSRPHVVVATPGRLSGLLRAEEPLCAVFAHARFAVLDEADRMLDQEFAADVGYLLALLPADRQTLLFSATQTPTLEALVQRGYISNSKSTGADVNDGGSNALSSRPLFAYAQPSDGGDGGVGDSGGLGPLLRAAESVRQEFCLVADAVKDVYVAHLLASLDDAGEQSCVVFCGSKRTAALLELLVDELAEATNGAVPRAAALHAKKSQRERLRVVQAFKAGEVRVLIATLVASRGLDIPEVDLVISYDLPRDPRDFVHCIGRAGRAGRPGRSVAVVTQHDVERVEAIEEATGTKMKEAHIDEDAALKRATKVRTRACVNAARERAHCPLTRAYAGARGEACGAHGAASERLRRGRTRARGGKAESYARPRLSWVRSDAAASVRV